MRPVRTAFTNAVFKLPGGTEENDLPAERTQTEDGDNVIATTWELNDIEAAKVARGARIELVIWGTRHPAVALRVEEEVEHDQPTA